jgi:hypothetical protein
MAARVASVYPEGFVFITRRIQEQPKAQRTAAAGAPLRCCRGLRFARPLIAVHVATSGRNSGRCMHGLELQYTRVITVPSAAILLNRNDVTALIPRSQKEPRGLGYVEP